MASTLDHSAWQMYHLDEAVSYLRLAKDSARRAKDAGAKPSDILNHLARELGFTDIPLLARLKMLTWLTRL